MIHTSRLVSTPPPDVQPNLTPLIDIVFNLLLFFILSTNYVQQTSFQLELPTAASGGQAGNGIIITLTRDERVFVGSDEVPLTALEEHLREKVAGGGDTPPALLIQADELVYHKRVVTLLDVARRVGITDLEVAATHDDRARVR